MLHQLLLNQLKLRTDPSDITECGEATGHGDQASAESTFSCCISTTVAVYLPQYRDELPLIGKVVSVDANAAQITVHSIVGYGSHVGEEMEVTILIGRRLCNCLFNKSFKLLKFKLKEAYRNISTGAYAGLSKGSYIAIVVLP